DRKALPKMRRAFHRSRLEPVHRIGLGIPAGRDSRRHVQINRYILVVCSKEDVSTSLKRGHFYFAPTSSRAVTGTTEQADILRIPAFCTMAKLRPDSAAHHERLNSSEPLVKLSSDRNFGLVFTAAFALTWILPVRRGGEPRWWALGVSVLFLTLAFGAPK